MEPRLKYAKSSNITVSLILSLARDKILAIFIWYKKLSRNKKIWFFNKQKVEEL